MKIFFPENNIGRFECVVGKSGPGVVSVVPHGPFANQMIANYINLYHDVDLRYWIAEFMTKLLGDQIDVAPLLE